MGSTCTYMTQVSTPNPPSPTPLLGNKAPSPFLGYILGFPSPGTKIQVNGLAWLSRLGQKDLAASTRCRGVGRGPGFEPRLAAQDRV